MKRFVLLTALITLFMSLNVMSLSAQNANPLNRETLQVSPDTLHLYFYGCSPHLELVTIINPTDELVVINRVYSENFRVDFLLEGTDVSETGTFLYPFDTMYFEVYASPYYGKDLYGDMIIETDIGDFNVVLFHESNVAVDESDRQVTLYPNPSSDHITVNGEHLGKVIVYNALGQITDVFYTDDNTIDIPTSKYPNGVYFIQFGKQKTKRFVVAH